jgi:hypothetical protein
VCECARRSVRRSLIWQCAADRYPHAAVARGLGKEQRKQTKKQTKLKRARSLTRQCAADATPHATVEAARVVRMVADRAVRRGEDSSGSVRERD